MDTEDYTENWPQETDKLFRSDLPDWQHNAVAGLSPDDIGVWYRYMNGYREAADRVVASSLEHDARGMFDVIVYPVIFLYRHHFELALKAIIRIGGRIHDQDDAIPGHHRLLELWKKARPVLEKHWPEGGTKELDATGSLLDEIDKSDPGSFCFRYPEARNGTPSLPIRAHINLRHFAVTAGKMSDFLTSCVGGLWNDLDQKQTYLSDMQTMYGNEGGW